MHVFDHVPTLSLRMDLVLAQIDTLLDADTILQAIKTDLLLRFPQTSSFVSDSLVLRQFCRVYCAPVPDQSILSRWARLI